MDIFVRDLLSGTTTRVSVGGRRRSSTARPPICALIWAVCINVSGLRVRPWPRWRSARPGP